jgi:hypothetical protein
MKYIILLLLLVCFTAARPQVKFFMVSNSGTISSPDGSIKLTSGTFSCTGSTPFDVDISAYTGTYRKITLRLYGMISTAATDGLHLQVSADGINFDAGSTDYKQLYNLADAAGGFPAPYLNIIPSIFSNTAGEIFWVDIDIVNAGSSSDKPTFRWAGAGTDNTHASRPITGGGRRDAVQLTKKLRCLSNGGTVSGGYELRGE